jgi:hypothetical protein
MTKENVLKALGDLGKPRKIQYANCDKCGDKCTLGSGYFIFRMLKKMVGVCHSCLRKYLLRRWHLIKVFRDAIPKYRFYRYLKTIPARF